MGNLVWKGAQILTYNDSSSPFKDTLLFINKLKVAAPPPQTRKSIDIYANRMREAFSDQIIECWEKELEQFPKLETYTSIKECFQCAPYLLNNESFKSRQLLCQLRISSHNLNVEVGRYLGQRRDKRICSICKNGDIENEFHFVMKCSSYDALRNEVFNKLNELNLYEWEQCTDDEMKFRFILQAYNKNAMKIICDFIQKLNDTRRLQLVTVVA